MSNSLVRADRSEPKDLRSDLKRFKNKYKDIILKKYHDSINKPNICWIQMKIMKLYYIINSIYILISRL
jgi:hypothetical protein